jgi:predicted Rossmann fold nucleotide-binding protein DprA/Smf involved in DNA uptake
MGEAKQDWREGLKAFRERLGGLTEAKKAMAKDQRDTTKAILDALKNGPRTVPELSETTRIPSQKVLWYVMALKRYGKIAEAGLAGDYYRYERKEKAQ